ncbi:TraB/GumN family protein [Ureibacillus sinduriensis]|uniref:Conjugal transfer protein TraB n=1 Tax=Ureibacillus sinduriensis BLB-1 = JCM 15800 TaxID=1384057 RepID=A0A0A3HVA9_9BACL|nr:TraB/GumN family protein [Ureibacillus sinduriensis]KGR76541.1 conjugal transfer protein TraB [Ureibacillus sinduriensis BLB-1 = JCM 15800]
MKKMYRNVIATMLGFVLLFSTVVPAIQAEEGVPDVSPWAAEILNEGEKYGVFSTDLYFDGFRSDISIEKLNELLALTEDKIASLQLSENKDFKPASYKEDTTRGDIINRLYNIVAQYDLPVGDDAVAYMKERGILKGSGKGLDLDKKSTTQDAVVLAIRVIKDTYHLADKGSKGVAWVVEDEDTQVYLLGSIHLGTPDLYPFNQKLLNAFEESDALLVEANILDVEALDYYAEKAMYAEGKTVKDAVSAETFAKLEKVAETYGLSMDQLMNQKPWLLSSSLSMLGMDDSFGITPEEMSMHGIDMYFLLDALMKGKPVIELEGTRTQVDMFDALSPEGQEQMLLDTLNAILEPSAETENDVMLDWFENWKKGDIEKFAASLQEMEGDTSEFNTMLFGERDANMAAKITNLLEEEEGTFFVVVGAGHFLVDKNIRYHLEQDGYTVQPFYQ